MNVGKGYILSAPVHIYIPYTLSKKRHLEGNNVEPKDLRTEQSLCALPVTAFAVPALP